MKKCLNLFPYKIKSRHPLNVFTTNQSEIFTNDLIQKIDVYKVQARSIWFSDEFISTMTALWINKIGDLLGKKTHASVQSSLHSPTPLQCGSPYPRKKSLDYFSYTNTVIGAWHLFDLRDFGAIHNAFEYCNSSS